MQKIRITFIITCLLLLLGITDNYAAFPVKEHKYKEELIAHHRRSDYKKSFSERRIPQFFSGLKKTLAAREIVHAQKKRSGWQGIASFSSSLLAIFMLFAAPVACIFFAIAAIVLGGVGLSRRKHKNTGFAIAGFAIGIVELILALFVIALISALSGLTINVM